MQHSHAKATLVGMAKCVSAIHEMFFHKNVSWCSENETNMVQDL